MFAKANCRIYTETGYDRPGEIYINNYDDGGQPGFTLEIRDPGRNRILADILIPADKAGQVASLLEAISVPLAPGPQLTAGRH